MEPLREKACSSCGVNFQPTREWSKYCSTKCKRNNPSKKNTDNAYRKMRRQKLNDIKQEVGCMRCGYNQHPAALHFDHRDPSTKVFNISHDPKRKWADIEAEIAKCDVLCANCHAIKTHEQYIYYTQRFK